MSDALLTILKWCLLALVYLFFFRVLQATWSGSTTSVAVRRVGGGMERPTAGSRAADDGTRAKAPEAVALTVLEPQADAGRRFEVTAEMTIGRSADCQISFDDTFISSLHAKVSPRADGLLVEDLGSTNGTYLNQLRVVGPALAIPGDRLQLGGVVLEIR